MTKNKYGVDEDYEAMMADIGGKPMSEPTEAQIKEFWEWCGFEYKYSETYREHRWYYPDHKRGKPYIVDFRKELPPIDLNNLFKYAVPKALEVFAKRGFAPAIMKLFQLWYDQLVSLAGDSNDIQYAALALFWTLDEVRHDKMP